MLLVGIRIHYKKEFWIEWYLKNLQNWFKFRKFDIIKSSVGLHKDTEHHHLHYHLLIEERKPLTNPIATFKYDFNKAKCETLPSNGEGPASMTSEEHKGRINISIKMTNSGDPEDFRKFLQYPLKENIPILDHCINIDTAMVARAANAEYQLSREREAAMLRKKKQKEDKDKSQWELMCDHLGTIELGNSIRKVYRNVFLYYRDNNEKPPTIRFMSDMAERYAFKKGYLTIDQLIDSCRY